MMVISLLIVMMLLKAKLTDTRYDSVQKIMLTLKTTNTVGCRTGKEKGLNITLVKKTHIMCE